MSSNKYAILILLLVLNISIRSQPSRGCSETETCVKTTEVDYLISEHIQADGLRIDTAILLKKIVDLKGIISYQDENAKALNRINADQEKIIGIYKKDFSEVQLKLQKAEAKASRRGRTVLILIGTTLIGGSIAILKP